MATKQSYPKKQNHYAPDINRVINCGVVKPTVAIDVEQVNVAAYLEGNHVGKFITMTLTDVSNGLRVFTSKNSSLDFNGNRLGFISFLFDKFHTKSTDEYIMTLELSDYSDASLFGIADWDPKINVEAKADFVVPVRTEFYGR